MKLSDLCDEDLERISMLKNQRGCATSEARGRSRYCTQGTYPTVGLALEAEVPHGAITTRTSQGSTRHSGRYMAARSKNTL